MAGEGFIFSEERMNTAERMNEKLDSEFKIFREKGIEPPIARYGEVDIAYPTNEEEYCVLGGYGVLMLAVIAEDRKELPVEKAYFKLSNAKIKPLVRLDIAIGGIIPLAERVQAIEDAKGTHYFENISFWGIPVCFFLDDGGFIAIDFKGKRKEFIIKRGPWDIDRRVLQWVINHQQKKSKVSEHITHDLIVKFIQREFVENNLLQL
jgi:hypothetical protein